MPNMSQGSYSVRITGTLILEGERPGGDVSHVAHTLRKFTIDPSRRQLRNLKGNFPLINVDTRETVREQQFQAQVQRKSAWTGGFVALLVAIGAELVKAAFGGQ